MRVCIHKHINISDQRLSRRYHQACAARSCIREIPASAAIHSLEGVEPCSRLQVSKRSHILSLYGQTTLKIYYYFSFYSHLLHTFSSYLHSSWSIFPFSSVLFSIDRFLPFLDLFHVDRTKVDMCKTVLEAFVANQTEPTSDPVIINALTYIGKVLIARQRGISYFVFPLFFFLSSCFSSFFFFLYFSVTSLSLVLDTARLHHSNDL